MFASHNRRPSQWARLFAIAADLLDQVDERTAGYPLRWSFGGGTAMMLQIGHRESHDVDIFLDDSQVLGFLDPAKAELSFQEAPSSYMGEGARFQKFAFEGIGEIDFIVAASLTAVPTTSFFIQDRTVELETIPEIVVKKIVHRGSQAEARDVFDIAAAARSHRSEIVEALRAYPDQVANALDRLQALNPDFVSGTIAQLMILPDYLDLIATGLTSTIDVLENALDESKQA
ncbi:nucleotidyl transferase AbiEii/AbiGii toxin family protein [Tianweitania populi]|nr:nucleotidyl transferase AbiEii/AbiGii toxin family protein [Tianweitania populi]